MPSYAWPLTVSAVLFDMDGTLVDSTAVVEHIWSIFAEQHSADLPTLLSSAHGRRTVDTVHRFARPGTDIDAAVAELQAREVTSTRGILAIRGSREFLDSVPPDQTAVVTSASRDLAVARLTAAGFRVPEVLVTSEDVENGKPDPEGYLTAAGQLGVLPGDAVVFEDAVAGIDAALAAGMRTIAIRDTEVDNPSVVATCPDFSSLHVDTINRGDGTLQIGWRP